MPASSCITVAWARLGHPNPLEASLACVSQASLEAPLLQPLVRRPVTQVDKQKRHFAECKVTDCQWLAHDLQVSVRL